MLYGNLRRQLPLFAAAGALSLLVALIPFPHDRTAEAVVAGILFFGLTAAAVLLPWPRLPLWLWPSLPIGYIGVVALLRDAQHGSVTGLTAIYVLPVVWVAYYGRATHLIAALTAVAAALIVPIFLVGAPFYPPSQWHVVAVIIVGSSLVSFTFLAALNRERRLLTDIALQIQLTRQGAREAEAAREQLSSLLRAATRTAVIGVEENGTVTFFSVGAERMFGLASSDVVGHMSFIDFLDPDDIDQHPFAFPHRIADADGNGPPDEVVATYFAKSRERRKLRATITRQSHDATRPGEYVIVASDVTEREELARERERLLAIQGEAAEVLVQQNAQLKELTTVKDDLVATVSHELRTPLTSILGFAELLIDDELSDTSGSISEDQLRMLKAITRNSRQLLHVANDLLNDPALGNGRGVRFTLVDLTTLAAEVVDEIRTTGGGHVDISLERTTLASRSNSDRIVINGDPPRLHQLLANLLSNAVKFNPPGGRVQLRLTSLGPLVRIDVSDDGPGIPPEERDQLFDLFYRLASANHKNVPGSGLGLAIAKSVVEAHSGTIEIVDVPGWSTTFRVHLPAPSSRTSAVFGSPSTSP